MKNVPRQPRSRSKTAIILCGRPSFFGYYFWLLGEVVAGEPLARRGEEAAGAVDEPLPFRCDVAAAGVPQRTARAG